MAIFTSCSRWDLAAKPGSSVAFPVRYNAARCRLPNRTVGGQVLQVSTDGHVRDADERPEIADPYRTRHGKSGAGSTLQRGVALRAPTALGSFYPWSLWPP